MRKCLCSRRYHTDRAKQKRCANTKPKQGRSPSCDQKSALGQQQQKVLLIFSDYSYSLLKERIDKRYVNDRCRSETEKKRQTTRETLALAISPANDARAHATIPLSSSRLNPPLISLPSSSVNTVMSRAKGRTRQGKNKVSFHAAAATKTTHRRHRGGGGETPSTHQRAVARARARQRKQRQLQQLQAPTPTPVRHRDPTTTTPARAFSDATTPSPVPRHVVDTTASSSPTLALSVLSDHNKMKRQQRTTSFCGPQTSFAMTTRHVPQTPLARVMASPMPLGSMVKIGKKHEDEDDEDENVVVAYEGKMASTALPPSPEATRTPHAVRAAFGMSPHPTPLVMQTTSTTDRRTTPHHRRSVPSPPTPSYANDDDDDDNNHKIELEALFANMTTHDDVPEKED